jgi:hypothetical protein
MLCGEEITLTLRQHGIEIDDDLGRSGGHAADLGCVRPLGDAADPVQAEPFKGWKLKKIGSRTSIGCARRDRAVG